MFVLSSVDVDASLVVLVSDAILDLGPEHHHRAVHEVVHHVFKLDFVSFKIDHVKQNLFFGDYLNPFIPFNEEDIATSIYSIVAIPV